MWTNVNFAPGKGALSYISGRYFYTRIIGYSEGIEAGGVVGALPRHPHTTRKRGVFRLQISVTFAEK